MRSLADGRDTRPSGARLLASEFRFVPPEPVAIPPPLTAALLENERRRRSLSTRQSLVLDLVEIDIVSCGMQPIGNCVPCAGLDELCAGSDALVHTVIRKDIIADIPIQRLQDTLDYHSSPAEAAQTAARAGVGTLVLTHYVPAFPSGGGDDWKALAAEHFAGRIELGDDLHRVEIEHGRS